MYDMSKREFELFKELIHNQLGISLSTQKIALLQSRLGKLLKQKEMSHYSELYDYFLQQDEQAKADLENAVTTNVTSFFRHTEQWKFLKEYITTHMKKNHDKKLRIWSAACSSGEEPYSMAIFLREHLNDFNAWDIKILATDVSEKILHQAIEGTYKEDTIEGLTHPLLKRYFQFENGHYRIDDTLRTMVMFRKFNLVNGDYSLFKTPFDLILCRNVLIYFDHATQMLINKRLSKILKNSGLLLVGHAETITSNIGNLKLLTSSIYIKNP